MTRNALLRFALPTFTWTWFAFRLLAFSCFLCVAHAFFKVAIALALGLVTDGKHARGIVNVWLDRFVPQIPSRSNG